MRYYLLDEQDLRDKIECQTILQALEDDGILTINVGGLYIPTPEFEHALEEFMDQYFKDYRHDFSNGLASIDDVVEHKFNQYEPDCELPEIQE